MTASYATAEAVLVASRPGDAVAAGWMVWGTLVPTMFGARRLPPVKPMVVLLAVSQTFGYSVADLRGGERNQWIAGARQAAYLLLTDLSRLPSKRVGELLGGRDHSTVLYGLRRAREQAATSGEYAALLADARAGALRTQDTQEAANV